MNKHYVFIRILMMKHDNTSEKDVSTILTQWQTCVEMANSISERRDTMNNLFVTLNLALSTAISFIWDTKTIMLLIIGIILCILWKFFIRNFKELNRAKFEEINHLEYYLPTQPFYKEWNNLKKNRKYIEGTKLEMFFPFTFLALYIIVLLVIICRYIGEKVI